MRLSILPCRPDQLPKSDDAYKVKRITHSLQMSTKKPIADLSMMTHVALQPIWFARLPAFQSSDANIVRGCLNMLMAAFHSQPAGTLPNSPEAIATTAQLPLEVAALNYKLLTQGWKMGKDTISFEPMVLMAQRLSSEYGDALQRLQDGVVVAIAAPDLFNSELIPTQGASLEAQVGKATKEKAQDILANTKVPRRLPEGATFTPALALYMQEKGFPPDEHREIWGMFYDFHFSRSSKSASWESEFKNWMMNQIRYGKLVPQAGVPKVFQTAMSNEVRERAPTPTPAVAPRSKFSFSRPGQNLTTSRGQELESQAAMNLSKAQEAVQRMRALRAAAQG